MAGILVHHGGGWGGAPELLTVPEDHVHVLVEGLELADEGPGVLEDDAHPVVDVVHHLVVLADDHPEAAATLQRQTVNTRLGATTSPKEKRQLIIY